MVTWAYDWHVKWQKVGQLSRTVVNCGYLSTYFKVDSVGIELNCRLSNWCPKYSFEAWGTPTPSYAYIAIGSRHPKYCVFKWFLLRNRMENICGLGSSVARGRDTSFHLVPKEASLIK